MCNIEFPHFGASYPDAHCINGYLWDMDSYENGCYTIGGDDPCPFCNTEAWLKTVLDNEEFASREEALAWVEKMREKWGAEHLADARKMSPNDLEEAAGEYEKKHTYQRYDGGGLTPEYNATLAEAVIFGAKWQKQHDAELVEIAYNDGITIGMTKQKEQMMKEAVEGYVTLTLTGVRTVAATIKEEDNIEPGDKVRIIIVKEGRI